MIKITKELIDDTLEKARTSPRKRINYNFHTTYDAPIQRMLNATEPGTYVRPHKHEDPDKVEVFIILKGKVAFLEYDNEGDVADHVILDTEGSVRGVESPPRTWHSFIALDKDSVLYEVKDGPYDPSADKKFAPWSPEEGSEDSSRFLDKTLSSIKTGTAR